VTVALITDRRRRGARRPRLSPAATDQLLDLARGA
jgi:hypothetical protein